MKDVRTWRREGGGSPKVDIVRKVAWIQYSTVDHHQMRTRGEEVKKSRTINKVKESTQTNGTHTLSSKELYFGG